MALILPVLIAVVLLTASLIDAACNLRCPKDRGSVIVCDGDTKFETIQKCGEPDHKEDVGFISSGKFGSITNATSTDTSTDTDTEGAYRELFRSVEKWYYNCGEGRFIKVITFKGNEVVSIENGDWGSGPQKCW
jgi:hypothetical protein